MADSIASVSPTLVAAGEQDRPIGALSVTAPEPSWKGRWSTGIAKCRR
jgi:hypothetical protein